VAGGVAGAEPASPGGSGFAPAKTGSGFAKMAAAAATSSPGQVLDLAEKAIVRSFTNPNADPTQALFALSHMLEEFNPNVLLPALSPEKREAFKGRPTREIAADLMEDAATTWAVNRMQTAGPQDAGMTEEEIVRVLQRSLEATQSVDRMLQKLSRVIQKTDLPPEFYARIQQELRWSSLPADKKRASLLEIQRYNASEFKRLLAYVREAVVRGRFDDACTLVEHYFAILNLTQHELQPAELARAPELLQLIARLQTSDFMQAIGARLTRSLLDEELRGWYHHHIANCLGTVAHSMAPYEDFDSVHTIALELEKSRQRDPEQHRDCCGEALGNLLGPRSIERLIELYASNKDSQRMVLNIIKLMGRLGLEKVFQRLEDEKKASTRMALIRLITQCGSAGTEVARQRLNDERWYVVRNACYVLSDLHDPQLTEELRPVLRHTDERVQQAAFNVISKSVAPGRGSVLADALLDFKPTVLEKALDELRFWKAYDSIPGLEKFVMESNAKPAHLEKAMLALLAMPEDGALETLANILKNPNVPIMIRRLAIAPLGRSSEQLAYEALSEVAARAPKDPLAPEAMKALEVDI
jgi:HEAT repeat protein